MMTGGLSFELSEGDIIAVMSQFGEIEDIYLKRDPDTGKSKGFAFVKYANQKSTVLAVDNLTGYQLLQRTLLVNHSRYKRAVRKRNRDEQEDSSDSDMDDDEVR